MKLLLALVVALSFAFTSLGAPSTAYGNEPPEKGKKILPPGKKKGFNPQPDPPVKTKTKKGKGHEGHKKGFNPQPEPPTPKK